MRCTSRSGPGLRRDDKITRGASRSSRGHANLARFRHPMLSSRGPDNRARSRHPGEGRSPIPCPCDARANGSRPAPGRRDHEGCLTVEQRSGHPCSISSPPPKAGGPNSVPMRCTSRSGPGCAGDDEVTRGASRSSRGPTTVLDFVTPAKAGAQFLQCDARADRVPSCAGTTDFQAARLDWNTSPACSRSAWNLMRGHSSSATRSSDVCDAM